MTPNSGETDGEQQQWRIWEGVDGWWVKDENGIGSVHIINADNITVAYATSKETADAIIAEHNDRLKPKNTDGEQQQWRDGMSVPMQIERLAKFIIETYPGEPSQSGGAIETAIRLMAAEHNDRHAARAALEVEREATRIQRVKAEFQFERANRLEAKLAEAQDHIAELVGRLGTRVPDIGREDDAATDLALAEAALAALTRQPATGGAGEPAMVRINGKRFACNDCGATVFTRRGQMYVCNGCAAEYEGEPATPATGGA